MDRIELKLELKEIEENWKGGLGCDYTVQQEVHINGCKFSGFCEILTFFQDSHYVSRYDGVTSWSYLDSCSCGAPGCSGIWEGIHIRKKKGFYYYSCRKRGGYRGGLLGSGKRFLRVPEENIHEIRTYVRNFYLSNQEKLENDHESGYIIEFFLR